MPHPSRLIAGMARQANLPALDAMIGAARAGSESVPYFADLAADLSSLASRAAKATKEMTEQVEGTSGDDDIAATLAAMRDAAIRVTDALRQRIDTTAAKRSDADPTQPFASNG
jgi:methyl-accepting chemotaxis protein